MIIARPRPGMPFSLGQLLLEHTENVALRSTEFAKLFHSGPFLQAAAILHDVGKADESWQRYLRESIEADGRATGSASRKAQGTAPVKHAAAGVELAFRHYGALGRVLEVVS